MLLDEIRQLLRELTADIGAIRTEVVHSRPAFAVANVRYSALGGGAFVRVEMPAADDACRSDLEVAAAMTRCVQALRVCARRWNRTQVPACIDSQRPDMPADRVHERIVGYLQALENSHGADLVVVTVRRAIVAASRAPDERYRERIPFIIRRVEVEAGRRKTSHGEWAAAETFALSFWFDACLVAFFSAPYAPDFIRHRARLVARELVPLLSMLDEPPPTSAQVAPTPDM